MNIFLILITYTAGLSVIVMMIHTFLREGVKSSIHKIYYLACFLGLTWCFSYFAMYLTGDPGIAAIAYRAGSAGWTLNLFPMFLLLIQLLEIITERKVSPIPGYCVIFSSFVFFAAALSGRLFASDFIRMPGGWWAEQVNTGSPWVMAYIIWGLTVLLMGALPLISMIRKARLKRHRRQILFIFSPLMIITIIVIIINLIFPFMGKSCPPIGHILISFYLAFIGCSIIKFRVIKPEPEIIMDPLLFQISDMVILTDNSGIILRVNRAVTELLGYEPEDLYSRNLSVILQDIMPMKQSTGEREAVTSDRKSIPVNCAINPIDDIHGDRIGFFILLKDLTRLKKLEELTGILRLSNRQLEQLSITDSLTGMFNRSKMESSLRQEIQRCRRYGSMLSIILYDIDHFKNINDTYGHAEGDAVLRVIADTVQQNIRETDIPGRWGGEEFLIICVNTDSKAAGVLAEKIRSNLEIIDHRGIGKVTASFGVTAYAGNDTPDSIIARGDNAMYDAKRCGRNLTTIL